jgi:hypothetical protein
VVVLARPGTPVDALRAVLERNGALVCRPNPALLDQVAGHGADRLVLVADSATADTAGVLGHRLRERGLTVVVMAVASPVQLIAALAVHDPHRPFDDDVAAMRAAVATTRHGVVRPAGDGVVGEFDPTAQRPPLHGRDATEVALALLGQLATGDAELVTIVAAAECGRRIEARLDGPGRGLEVVRLAADVGGQVWLGVE